MTLYHLESKNAPAPVSGPIIHNICGKFKTMHSSALEERMKAVKECGVHDALVRSADKFGHSFNIHTKCGAASISLTPIQGNISFKGARDTSDFLQAVRAVLGDRIWMELDPTTQPEVHMVVTTLSLGRKLDISLQSILIQNMHQLVGADNVQEMIINDEDFNTAAFVVTGWHKVYECTGRKDKFCLARCNNPCKASVTASNKGRSQLASPPQAPRLCSHILPPDHVRTRRHHHHQDVMGPSRHMEQ